MSVIENCSSDMCRGQIEWLFLCRHVFSQYKSKLKYCRDKINKLIIRISNIGT